MQYWLHREAKGATQRSLPRTKLMPKIEHERDAMELVRVEREKFPDKMIGDAAMEIIIEQC